MEMKNYLFFDTETTGIPDYKLDITDDKQPRLLRLAAIMTDDKGRILDYMDSLIRITWGEVNESEVSEDGKKTAFAVNGITNKMLQEDGLPIESILTAFRFMQDQCHEKIAYGYRFDGFVAKGEYARNNMDPGKEIERYCLMKAVSKLGKSKKIDLPHTKSPFYKLTDAYEAIFKKPLEGAHTPFADAMACKEIYFELKNRGFYEPQPRAKKPEK